MDIRSIRKLIEIVEQSGIAEIEIKEGEHNIRITRNQEPIYVTAPTQMQAAAPMQAAPMAAAPAVSEAQPVVVAAPSGHTVKSPMVGTFYTAPAPDAAPFVKVGDKVKEGDTLCIIEAMKIMNPIESDKTGTIKHIMGVNGEPVEYDQPLYIIE
ncbi:acetyl-CoA carboxylase biotin carboxyl carrier protein subunit [Thiosulfatimonas sediminis]|uniref:Biotin carboxyl carrier protein of acetyl-CoA carboxylase n=1 Tax=Thiosulfatimonas sediminis TaxID=2675054 RepID=A0A6F8PX22_9GAMM|nr:acetyl-CoA carboxylase biotin carboxyl carrier protein [Thiosulfatimonas sediminis]BBP46669.1 acetyl-CoA carboxylase biotin carboxyl carrier protein subunit [Thiosulfatimonas sediminis]